MYFYKLLILVALLTINIFAASESDSELERHFAVGGSMEGFSAEGKATISRLYGSLDVKVKTLLLGVFAHGGYMKGSCSEEQSIDFLNMLGKATQESTPCIEIRSCIHSMRRFNKKDIIQNFCHIWKNWEEYRASNPASPLNPFLNIRQYIFTFTSILDEGGEQLTPFNVMEIMYSIFSTNLDAGYVNEEFLKWLCLNNKTKKKVVSRLNFKGVFKGEDRAIIRRYLGFSKALPRDRVSKVLLMETKSVDDDKADELELMVKKRDTATRAFVADERVKMAAERADERERQLRGAGMWAPRTRSSFMSLAEEGDEPDLPSTEKKSEDVTDGYASDSSQSMGSVGSVDDDFDLFARSQTPVFGQSMNPAMYGVPA